MKILHCVSTKLILVAIACSFAASTPVQAREAKSNAASSVRSGDDARLVVKRSANFGIDESINLVLDGVQIATLGINQSYDAVLPPGEHVLSITTNPKTYGQTRPPQYLVTAKPGKIYTFTAVWDDSERASLVEQ